MKAIDELPQDHPDYVHYAARRTTALQRAGQYEATVLSGIVNDEKNQDWPSAIAQLDTALSNYPESRVLQKKHAELFNKQLHRTRKLNAEALLARAEWLQNEIPLMKQRAANAPVDISLHWSLGKLEKELAAMADKLITSATELFEHNEYALIQRCLDGAIMLGANQNEQNTITLLQERLNTRRAEMRQQQITVQSKRKQQYNHAQQSRHQQNIKKLLAMARLALEKNDLYSAQAHVSRLMRDAPTDSEVEHLYKKILTQVRAEVDEMTAKGNSLYRQERIAEAKAVWEKALRLDPDNRELKTHIDRATRVLTKLQNLRNVQQAY
ncbi:MAG: tetratricopeptide repeat protein [Granulosicoccaceae bacterium]